ncbi:hypothetical protein CCAX7_14700 [Capsulimonas corticalis]|uniref:Uncharacterized protein n=1 Tax=Capsulimonas corticalis TaxID=2219043 RepID=A0A402CZE0_9BACT|nr:hypothetical protein [Capsulimonas corticalis]BDI29419.1 hypothetical protein CCAX7_14700 [Capsulimonas corticalis]
MADIPFGSAPDQVVGGPVSYGVVFAIDEYATRNNLSRTAVLRLALASFAGRRGLLEPPPPALPWIHDKDSRAYMADLGKGRAVIVQSVGKGGYAKAEIHLLELGVEDVVERINHCMATAGYIATVMAARRWPDLRETFPLAPTPGIDYNLGSAVPRTVLGWEDALSFALRKAA